MGWNEALKGVVEFGNQYWNVGLQVKFVFGECKQPNIFAYVLSAYGPMGYWDTAKSVRKQLIRWRFRDVQPFLSCFCATINSSREIRIGQPFGAFMILQMNESLAFLLYFNNTYVALYPIFHLPDNSIV